MDVFFLYGLLVVIVVALLVWYFFTHRPDKLVPIIDDQKCHRILLTKALRQLNSKITWKKD